MSNKFKYAPGKPGFGSKGNTGEDGDQGLAIYFTDYDPASDINLINLKITNNQALWSAVPPVSLPGDRVYVTGDLFFDSDGKCYEIDAENNTFTYRFATLNMGGFFSSLGISSEDGFERYFNSNSSPKYLIDNVYTTGGVIDYSQIPFSIYGIKSYNFTRYEYSNVNVEGYNPFTVYSSGLSSLVDDHKAIAIVRDISENTFRIGNLNDNGDLRNVNITFDVSSLKQTKEVGNSFTINTPTGTVLTNYEINANSLFDSNFNTAPSSFTSVFHSSSNDVSLYWNLSDFTNGYDSDITGILYFFTTINSFTGNSYSIDASILRPLIFNNVDSSGVIKITGLNSNESYSYYMKLNKNGWSRNSDIQYVYGGALTVSPLSYVCVSGGYGGTFGAESSIGFNVDANTTWDVSLVSNPNTFMTDLFYASTDGNDGSIFINLTENASAGRYGTIRVTPSVGIAKDVSIYQEGAISTVVISATLYSDINDSNDENLEIDHIKRWGINLTGLPENTTVDISIYCRGYTANYNQTSAVYYNDTFKIVSATKGEETYNKVDSCAAGQIKTYDYAGLSMIDVSTSDAIEIVLDSYANATPGHGTYYEFIHVIYIDSILVKFNSGDPISIVNNTYQLFCDDMILWP